MRRLTHVLHSAGKNGRRFVELDLLGSVDDRLNPRAAETIDGQRGDFFRNPRFQTHVTRAVNRVAGCLQRIPHNDMIDLLGRHAAARERFLRRDDAEIDRADFGEMTVVLGHRSSCAVEDYDVFHDCTPGTRNVEC